MPNIPTPIKAALGLAATAVDEARKLPETLPQAVTTVPLMAVSTAMQASMKVQQHIATLAARGEEVLSQLRGSSAEPPSWATFDDSPETPDQGVASIAADPRAGKAAFDRIDYDTGFAEGAEDDAGKGRWDAVGVGGTEDQPDPTLDAGPALSGGLSASGEDDLSVTATPPVAAGPTPPAPGLADAVSAPDLPQAKAAAKKAAAKAPAKTGAAKAGPGKVPAKSDAAKAPAKSSAAKTGAAKANPAKAPAKAAKRAGRKEPDHEPLEVAARKAKPSPTPNPATMAAEILQAQEAAADDE